MRACKYVIVFTVEPQPLDLSRIVAWLGFVPHLL